MTTIFVPILDLEAVLGREQLEHLARPLLDRTVAATRLALRIAGIRAEAVVAVFLVGGSSRMSLSATLLHRALGVAPTVIEQPELIVASGTLHLGNAEPLNAEPSSKSEEPPAVPPVASPGAVAEQSVPLAAPGRLGPPVPISPVPVSPAPASPVPGLPGLVRFDGHEQGGKAESVEPPPAGKRAPGATAQVVAPAVPARSRRRLRAVLASALATVAACGPGP
jgi:hypothetical protein